MRAQSPLNFVQMYPTTFFAQTDHPITFQCCEKDQTQTVNQFQVLGRSIPTVEQDALGLGFLGKNRIDDHFGKMIVFAFAILVWRINAVIHWIGIFLCTRTVHQIDHAYPSHQTVFCAAVLQFRQLNEP
jgi:hypothetical protein